MAVHCTEMFGLYITAVVVVVQHSEQCHDLFALVCEYAAYPTQFLHYKEHLYET